MNAMHPAAAPRRAAVTGAASGIGRALLHALAARGDEVIGVDRDADGAARTRDELAARGYASRWLLAELSADAGLERVVADLPELDLLVHCAGINAVGRFAHAELATLCAVLDVNLRAPLQLTRGLLAADKLRDGGALVFVSSLSHYVGYPGAAAYAASKDGVAAYARSLALALEPRGVRVLTVFPGPTRTPHARAHAPPGASEAGRMAPERVADETLRALARGRRRLIPGWRNRLFAVAGRLAPAASAALLRRALLERREEG